MKLLAVDGNSIVNRAYYGIRALATKDGIFTNGIYGFLTILQRMTGEVEPDAFAITFDLRAPTFRHKKYAEYKGTRKGMPDDLAIQMPLLKELLGYLGYVIVEKEGYEADDLLGTLSLAACESGNSCVIATGDRDSFQLVNDCVTVRLASTKGGQPEATLYDVAAIRGKYGVDPKQLIDVKAIMGDSSDNVPGVAGIGEKGALALIQEHGSLERVYDELDSPDIKAGTKQKLLAAKEMAFLSKELVTIDCHAPIDTETGRYLRREINHAEAYALMARLELFSLIDKLGVRPAADKPGAEEEEEPPLRVAFNSLPDGMLAEGKQLDALFRFEGKTLASLAVMGADTFYLFDRDVDEIAKRILTSPAKKRTNHIKTLHHYAMEHGFSCENITFDAEIAGYILNPTATGYEPLRLAGELRVAPLALDNLLGPHSELLEECAVFPALADRMTERLRDNYQIPLFREVELPLALVLADMERIGFELDTEGLRAFGEKLDVDIESDQKRVYELAGEEFNINSPKQLGVILFEKLGLPAGRKTKTGYSTDADTLEALRTKHEIVEYILQFRTVAKLKSTYVDGLLRQVGADGRIHTVFQQTLTRTGRISSTEPNLQNIPIRTELGSELRRFFRAKKGSVLVDADYSQIELRVLAHIAGDAGMTEAFRAGEDIHRKTAAEVFDMPPELVTPLMRSRAKAVNFGIVYGIGAYSLSQDIGVSVAEADKYMKGYLDAYGGVRQYMADTIAFGTEHGFVSTLLERRRYLPELASSSRPTKEFGKRVAMNTPIQGTAADIIKIAMVKVWNRLAAEKLAARLILQVHDELIVECPESELAIVRALVKEEMEAAMELSAPLLADVNSGENWLEAK